LRANRRIKIKKKKDLSYISDIFTFHSRFKCHGWWTLAYCRSFNRLHFFCFIASYLIIFVFIFSLFEHYFYFSLFLLVLLLDLKNRYELKTIFEMLIHRVSFITVISTLIYQIYSYYDC